MRRWSFIRGQEKCNSNKIDRALAKARKREAQKVRFLVMGDCAQAMIQHISSGIGQDQQTGSGSHTSFDIHGTIYELHTLPKLSRWQSFTGLLDNIDALIFSVSLMSYKGNQLAASMESFGSLCKAFPNIPAVLFFADKKAFEWSISNNPISRHELFRDYKGDPEDVKDAVFFIAQSFQTRMAPAKDFILPDLFVHIMHDSQSTIDFLVDTTGTIIWSKNLLESGLLPSDNTCRLHEMLLMSNDCHDSFEGWNDDATASATLSETEIDDIF